MTNGLALQGSAPNPIAHPSNISLNFSTSRTNTGVVGYTLWAATVQILRADADTDNAVSEGSAEVTSRSEKGVEFVLVYGAAGGCPQADEDLGVCVDGGAEGLDGRGRGAALDRGVQASGLKARSAGERFGVVEVADEVTVASAGAIVVCGAVVETLDLGRGGGCQSEDGSDCCFHGDYDTIIDYTKE